MRTEENQPSETDDFPQLARGAALAGKLINIQKENPIGYGLAIHLYRAFGSELVT